MISLFNRWPMAGLPSGLWRWPVSKRRASSKVGKVWLVGAGPGDPELMTLKGWRALQQADVVVYDRLVAPALLDACPARALRVDVGKQPGRHTVPQSDIEALLVRHALAGRTVVRLKGGDPGIFGRGGEETDALRAAGVPLDIVPGVTAASGCAAAAGFPLTQRGIADSVCLVTATHGDEGDQVHWSSLAADPRRTLVFYMGRARLALISEQLQRAGMSATTPAALIENGTTVCQRRYLCQLSELADCAAHHALSNPCLLVIGHVVRQAEEVDGVVSDALSRVRDETEQV